MKPSYIEIKEVDLSKNVPESKIDPNWIDQSNMVAYPREMRDDEVLVTCPLCKKDIIWPSVDRRASGLNVVCPGCYCRYKIVIKNEIEMKNNFEYIKNIFG